MDFESLIRNIPDFPKPGIQFKDITTLLKNSAAFHQVIDLWKERYQNKELDAIVGAEARGFIFGSALAYALNLPFVPVRKPGKLPAATLSESFELEYGTDTLEIHADALSQGNKVVLIDDLLATGGTMAAICRLMERMGVQVVEIAFLIELLPLKGRQRLEPYPVHSLVQTMLA